MLGVCKKCGCLEWTGILEQTKGLCLDCVYEKEQKEVKLECHNEQHSDRLDKVYYGNIKKDKQ